MKIQDFSTDVNNIIKKDGFPSLLDNIDQLFNTYRKDIFTETLNNSELLTKVAISSYRHQNHFDKVVIYKDSTGWSLRIHVWDNYDNDDLIDSNIHNHRWDYVSKIMDGIIKENIYFESDNGEDVYKYLFFTDENNLSHYNKISSAKIKIERANRYDSKSSVYYSSNNVVHQIIPITKTASTFFIQSSSIKKQSTIYTKKPLEFKDLKNERVYLDLKDIKTLLNKFI